MPPTIDIMTIATAPTATARRLAAPRTPADANIAGVSSANASLWSLSARAMARSRRSRHTAADIPAANSTAENVTERSSSSIPLPQLELHRHFGNHVDGRAVAPSGREPPLPDCVNGHAIEAVAERADHAHVTDGTIA